MSSSPSGSPQYGPTLPAERVASDLEARIARLVDLIAYAETLDAVSTDTTAGVPLEKTHSHRWLRENNLFPTEQLQTNTLLGQYENLAIIADNAYTIDALEALYNLLLFYHQPDYETERPDGTTDYVLDEVLADLASHPMWSEIGPLMAKVREIKNGGDDFGAILQLLASEGVISLDNFHPDDLATLLHDLAPIGGEWVTDEDGFEYAVLRADISYQAGASWEDIIRLANYKDALAADSNVARTLPQLRSLLGNFNPYAEYTKLTQIKTFVDSVPDIVANVSLETAKREFRAFETRTREEVDLMVLLRQALVQADTATTPAAIADEEEYRKFLLAQLWSALGIQAEWTNLSAADLQDLAYRLLRDHIFEQNDEIRQAFDEITRAMQTRLGSGPSSPLEIAFFVFGFFPVVGELVDIVDILSSLARGDVIGAAINLLPAGIDNALQGAGRLAKRGSAAMGRVTSTGRRVSAETLANISIKISELSLYADQATQLIAVIRATTRGAGGAANQAMDDIALYLHNTFFWYDGFRFQGAGDKVARTSDWRENWQNWNQKGNIYLADLGGYNYGPDPRNTNLRILDDPETGGVIVVYWDDIKAEEVRVTLNPEQYRKFKTQVFRSDKFSPKLSLLNSTILDDSVNMQAKIDPNWNWRKKSKSKQQMHHIFPAQDPEIGAVRQDLETVELHFNGAWNGVALDKPIHDMTKRDDYLQAIKFSAITVKDSIEDRMLRQTIYAKYADIVGRKLATFNGFEKSEIEPYWAGIIVWMKQEALQEAMN